MTLKAYDASVGVFVRGLTNLKTQLAKAEIYAADSGCGEAALLNARLVAEEDARGQNGDARKDLHMYSLAAQVHWAAEGVKLAIGQLLGAAAAPAVNDAKSFADLQRHLDATIAYLRESAPSALEAGLNGTIVIEHPRGSVSASGSQFVLAFAIPHFYYHVTSAYGILRNEGVPLTMGDFLGDWGAG